MPGTILRTVSMGGLVVRAALLAALVVAPTLLLAAGGQTAQGDAPRADAVPPVAEERRSESGFVYRGLQGIAHSAESIPPDAPRFEVATVRRDLESPGPTAGQARYVEVRGNRVWSRNSTLRELIRAAYNLQYLPRSFVAGGPTWIDSEVYVVEAVALEPFGPVEVLQTMPPDAAAMLRALLADRFKLQMRNETREAPLYELVVERDDGRLGPNLAVSDAPCISPFALVDLGTTTGGFAPAGDDRPWFCPVQIGPGPDGYPRMVMRHVEISDLALFLGLFPNPALDRPIVDRTGLTDYYDLEIVWQDDTLSASSTDIVERAHPTLPGALRQQLGLRLERVRGPVEILVIDQVERPSEN
jgi:uncharacterized protein (TIGR03435 family)